MVDVVDYEAGEGHAEDGGYVDGGAVYLSFGGAPVVIQESRIAKTVLHLTDTVRPTVLQDFVIIYTEELVGRERSGTLHLLAESSTERTTAHIPELRHLDLKRIRLQGSTQRAVELSRSKRSAVSSQ